IARLHHRRDLTYRPVEDAPQSSVALSWLEEETTDLMEQFIGIVRGRTVNSTRGRSPEPAERKRPERKPAAAKAANAVKAAKPVRRNAGGGAGKRRRRA
ncbi:LysR family transcriptional regulator, partial [Amycolatopsis mediterranei]